MKRKVKLKTTTGRIFETKQVIGDKDYIVNWNGRIFVYVSWFEFAEEPITKIAYAEELK